MAALRRITRAALLSLSGLAGFAATDALHAQEVRGRVTDAASGNPVALAMVTLQRADSVHARVITNAEGRFSVPAPSAGTWTLRVERLGYMAHAEAPLEVEQATSHEFDIQLRPNPIALDSIAVGTARERGRAGFERRRAEWDRGTHVDGIELALSGGGRQLDLISAARGFTLDRDRRLRPFHTRGCLIVFLDNIPDPILFSTGERGFQPRSTWSSFEPPPLRLAFGGMFEDLDYLLENVHVRGVEMYRSISDVPDDIRNGFRAKALRPFGQMGGCGAAIIWTNDGW
jgi:hypothetical protein